MSCDNASVEGTHFVGGRRKELFDSLVRDMSNDRVFWVVSVEDAGRHSVVEDCKLD